MLFTSAHASLCFDHKPRTWGITSCSPGCTPSWILSFVSSGLPSLSTADTPSLNLNRSNAFTNLGKAVEVTIQVLFQMTEMAECQWYMEQFGNKICCRTLMLFFCDALTQYLVPQGSCKLWSELWRCTVYLLSSTDFYHWWPPVREIKRERERESKVLMGIMYDTDAVSQNCTILDSCTVRTQQPTLL